MNGPVDISRSVVSIGTYCEHPESDNSAPHVLACSELAGGVGHQPRVSQVDGEAGGWPGAEPTSVVCRYRVCETLDARHWVAGEHRC